MARQKTNGGIFEMQKREKTRCWGERDKGVRKRRRKRTAVFPGNSLGRFYRQKTQIAELHETNPANTSDIDGEMDEIQEHDKQEGIPKKEMEETQNNCPAK